MSLIPAMTNRAAERSSRLIAGWLLIDWARQTKKDHAIPRRANEI